MATLCNPCQVMFKHRHRLQDTPLVRKGPCFRDSMWDWLRFFDTHNMKRHHSSLDGMQSAAQAGCEFCNILSERWNQLDPRDREYALMFYTQLQKPLNRTSGCTRSKKRNLWSQYRGAFSFYRIQKRATDDLIQICFQLADRVYQRVVFELFPQNSLTQKTITPDQLALPELDITTGSEQSLAQIQKWYTECKSAHPACNQRMTGAMSDWIPTRVINIGFLNCTHEPFLEIPGNDTIPFCYVTLSHCWGAAGSPRPPKLTVANLDALKQKIPMVSLPRTFADAIRVARKLSIHYLWIDSLCIIQDSAEDWHHESGQMDKVYQRAAFNISAEAADDCEGGLFFDRDPNKLGTFTIFQKRVGNLPHNSYVCHTQHYIRHAMRLKLNRPLSSRGWVYQERILALRQISFCSNQIFWNCSQTEACERLPLFSATRAARFENIVREILSGVEFSRIRLFAAWYKTVEDYTRCALSEMSDRLVAIQGLANLYQGSMRSAYIAGLWMERLAWELLWKMEDGLQGNGHPAFRPHIYRAPTWSWASVEGQVSLKPEISAKSLIQILDVNTAASGCSIKLRGRLMSIRECNFSAMQGYIAFGSLKHDAAKSWIHCFIDDREQWDPDGLYLVPFIIAEKARFGSYFRGLVLSQTDEDQDIFQRVGIFNGADPRENGAEFRSDNLEEHLSKKGEQVVILV